MANILIVDDSIVMRNNLEYLLTKEGHKVVGKASNGKEGVSLYKELKPDLVTMDISMPGLNGVEAVSQIINIDPEAKIVMISALNQKQMLFDAIKKGAKHYIIKPLETKEAIDIVNKVLAQPKTPMKDKSKQNKENIMEKQPSFEIKNVNGSFLIYISNNMDQEAIHALDLTLQGLIFVKPLHIIFDFGGMEELQLEMLHFIKEIVKKMNHVGAKISYEANNKALVEKLKCEA